MTHSPARSLGDDTDLAHTGFKTFLDVMEKYRPRYMVHGHVHQTINTISSASPSRRHHRHQCVRLLPAGCARNRNIRELTRLNFRFLLAFGTIASIIWRICAAVCRA